MPLPAGVYDLAVPYERDGATVELHPVAVETESGLVLVDVGLPGAVPAVEDALAFHDHVIEDVTAVLLTHHDGDHAGAISGLLDATDALVFAHRDEAPFVDGRQHPVKTPVDAERYPPGRVDVELTGGAVLNTDAGPMHVVETPGHSPGHVSMHLVDHDLLLAGDALVADTGDGRLHGPKPEYTPNLDRAHDSLDRLASLEVEQTLCYHGGLVEAGTDRIRELADDTGRDRETQ